MFVDLEWKRRKHVYVLLRGPRRKRVFAVREDTGKFDKAKHLKKQERVGFLF